MSDIAMAIARVVRRRWHWFTLVTVAIVGVVVSWSFPSGHAMNALVGYTMLACPV